MANVAQYRPHSFEVAKQNINYMASRMSSDKQLASFRTGDSFLGFFDHRVTGAEINSQLVAPLQEKLSDVTKDIRNLFDIAHNTYNALESLDKYYIGGIVDGVNKATTASASAEAASKEAKAASQLALRSCAENKKAQDGIERTLEALRATFNEFKNYKQQTNAALNSLRSNLDSINAAVGGIQNLKRDMANQQSAFENRMRGAAASQKVGYAAHQQPLAAYIIAGAALAISIVHLVLNACGVL